MHCLHRKIAGTRTRIMFFHLLSHLNEICLFASAELGNHLLPTQGLHSLRKVKHIAGIHQILQFGLAWHLHMLLAVILALHQCSDCASANSLRVVLRTHFAGQHVLAVLFLVEQHFFVLGEESFLGFVELSLQDLSSLLSIVPISQNCNHPLGIDFSLRVVCQTIGLIFQLLNEVEYLLGQVINPGSIVELSLAELRIFQKDNSQLASQGLFFSIHYNSDLDCFVMSILHLAEIAATRQIMNDVISYGLSQCLLGVDTQCSWSIAVHYSHLGSQTLSLHVSNRKCIIFRTVKIIHSVDWGNSLRELDSGSLILRLQGLPYGKFELRVQIHTLAAQKKELVPYRNTPSTITSWTQTEYTNIAVPTS